jgi:hypothetical protein
MTSNMILRTYLKHILGVALPDVGSTTRVRPTFGRAAVSIMSMYCRKVCTAGSRTLPREYAFDEKQS